ncbi:MAG: addiction module antidote protein, HigA family [Verrucomicrobia bacterium]|nr:MAG: addiction module antidote protein, HigA family [Verrucomicrobiota bacterium]
MPKKKLDPVHPGEILLEEFLRPLNLSQNSLARSLRVPPRRINEIVLGKRRLTADTALRLAHFFQMSPEFWLGLQMDYELDLERDRVESEIQDQVGRYKEAS